MLRQKMDANGNPVLGADGKPVMEEVANPTFDDNQQAFINSLFDKRFASITEKHNATVAEKDKELKALQEKLAALEAGNGGSGKGKGKEGVNGDEEQFKQLLAAEKQNSETNRQAALKAEQEKKDLLSKISSIEKRQAIVSAATALPSGNKFHDLDLVLTLVDKNIEWSDEHNQYVVKENGVIKKNSSMLPASVTEYLEGFAAQRPYLVAGKTQGGAGSSEGSRGQFGAGVVKTKADLKTPEEKSEYITKFGYEQFEKLPLK